MAEKLTFKKIGGVVWDYIQLTVGTLLYCVGWTSFLIPNGITSGGLTGLCTTIQFGLGIPVGISFPILNTCLLILGFLFLGKAFGFRTIYVIALSSVLFKVLPGFPVLEVLMEEKLLVCLLGAGLEAVGIGITLNKGGSTGGTDIIAMLVNKYWPVSPGRVYLICDIFIVSLIFLLPDKGIVDIIYAVVVMVTFSLSVDYVLMGTKSSVQILVFSSKYGEIADHMIHDMNRGVTALDSVGWYTQKEGKVLLIVARKQEMNNVIRAIKEIDKSAFISVSTAKSVYGEGFEEVKTGIKKRKDKNDK
ncbi:MAG: YitT family protein [Candidatus Cryptobacteroides sp.]